MAKLIKGARYRKTQTYGMVCNGRLVGEASVQPDPDYQCGSPPGYLIQIDVSTPRPRGGIECAETRAEAEALLREIAAKISCADVVEED